MENSPQIGIFVVISGLAFFCLILILVTVSSFYRRRIFVKEAKIKEIEREKQIIEKEQQINNFKLVNETEEREKEKIAKDLHDSVLPILGTLGRSIGKNTVDYGTESFDIARLKKDTEIIERLIVDVRGISHNLVPPQLLKYGLIPTLRDFIELQTGLSGQAAEFDTELNVKDALPLSTSAQLNIYRIIMELVNNLNKHSEYETLRCIVEPEGGDLLVEILHDGKAITTEKINELTETSKGLGLKSIRSRVLLLNGSLDYSTEGEASRITLKVPMN